MNSADEAPTPSGGPASLETGLRPGGLLADLQARGLIDECTDLQALDARLEASPITHYCGYDPTADSLHVGSLLSVGMQRRFVDHGHTAIVVIGGATGMVGDPSGRSSERNLLDAETLDHNRDAIRKQIDGLLGGVDGARVVVVDNRDWLGDYGLLDFLREVGKLVPVSEMLGRTSVRSRLAAGGLSFTEFSYQVLQAEDFSYLRETHSCELQLGGSDQYGNITAGTDLIRRRGLGGSFGLVWPLLTKADGSKFGKTADGTVWLDPKRTSPYQFHHFWFNAPDSDVAALLSRFTFISREEIREIVEAHNQSPAERLAQRQLADAMTEWVHGHAACARVNRARDGLFGRTELDAGSVSLLSEELPCIRLPRRELTGANLEDILVSLRLAESRSDARRTISAGGAYVEGKRVAAAGSEEWGLRPWAIVRRGSRRHGLVIVSDEWPAER